MENPRIVTIEYGDLEGERPRVAGKNARIGIHGKSVHVPIMRVTTEDGFRGFGVSWAGPGAGKSLLGCRLDEVFDAAHGVRAPWLAFEYPLWDLIGQRLQQPVYALAAAIHGKKAEAPLHVRCYDTSLYFDDLHLPSQEQAAQLLAQEALEGYHREHRAFKIKIGRGARHMALEEGTARDIAIVRAVREAVGPTCAIMLDANNGYNLNLAKHVLTETAECSIFWLEEAFYEDASLYRDLHAWIQEQHLSVLISDGEGYASPDLLSWAQEGLVDIIQYDIFDHGFTRWLTTGHELDAYGVRCAPHHYGSCYGNYVSCHLKATIDGFLYAEWDSVDMPGLNTSRYHLSEGWVTVPDAPGFGLSLDEEIFQRGIHATGATLRIEP